MKRIVIFGAGYHGRAAYRKLINDNNYQILCFIDNKVDLIPLFFDGIEIFNPSKINEILFDQIIIAGRFIKEQTTQVIDLGVQKSKLLVMTKKDLVPTSKELEEKEKILLNALFEFTEVVSDNHILYWIDYGSLLAISRGESLSSCSDIDITLTSQKFAKKLWNALNSSKVFSKYELRKFTCNKKMHFYTIGDILSITIASKPIGIEEPITLDIHINFCQEDNIYMYSDLGYFHYSPKLFFSDFDTIIYKNMSLRIPINLNQYLTHIYGSSWEIPLDNWTNSGYKNIDRSLK
jgi:phosphorylcholine metabolism protein LicD